MGEGKGDAEAEEPQRNANGAYLCATCSEVTQKPGQWLCYNLGVAWDEARMKTGIPVSRWIRPAEAGRGGAAPYHPERHMTAGDVYDLYVKPRIPKSIHERALRTWRHLQPSGYLSRYAPQWLYLRVALASELLRTRYFLWRTHPTPTRLLGPLWRRARKLAEIDITYSCNLHCFNCDRSCEQDPSNDLMSIGQVRQFLEESRTAGNPWKRIRVLGGEPTLHPQFLEIINLIVEYRDKYSPSTSIELTTNGYGERVSSMLSRLPRGVEIDNTSKTAKVQPAFHSFNIAPLDLKEYAIADFANGCPITRLCGMGVTPYGYYPCAVAGAIDRTFGLNLGRKTLPKPTDSMGQELRVFCALCGHFKPPTRQPLLDPVMSATWVEAYARSRRHPAILSRLAEREG